MLSTPPSEAGLAGGEQGVPATQGPRGACGGSLWIAQSLLFKLVASVWKSDSMNKSGFWACLGSQKLWQHVTPRPEENRGTHVSPGPPHPHHSSALSAWPGRHLHLKSLNKCVSKFPWKKPGLENCPRRDGLKASNAVSLLGGQGAGGKGCLVTPTPGY